jgi:hypothetical protein
MFGAVRLYVSNLFKLLEVPDYVFDGNVDLIDI